MMRLDPTLVLNNQLAKRMLIPGIFFHWIAEDRDATYVIYLTVSSRYSVEITGLEWEACKDNASKSANLLTSKFFLLEKKVRYDYQTFQILLGNENWQLI